MKLPIPPPRYDVQRENIRNRELEQADQQNVKTDRDTIVTPGRIILLAPDGSKWALKVSNSGILSTEAVP